MKIHLGLDKVRFDERGLVPVIVQDDVNKEVLTLAYMNEESLLKTMETGESWFYSRSRQELWHKGETSGHTQHVSKMSYDCDQDAILLQVTPQGPACHTGSFSCFQGVEKSIDSLGILTKLEQLITERQETRPQGAYTTYLFEQGLDKILKKVGEEAAEVIIAAKNRSKDELRCETADLLYHLLVLLEEQKLPLNDVLTELANRHQK